MKKKIRILFITHSLEYGGSERVLTNLINKINLKKFEVHVLILKNVSKKNLNLNERDIAIHFLKSQRLRYSIFKLIKKINYINSDFIFTTSINLNLFIIIFRFLLNYKKNLVRIESMPSQHINYLPYKYLYKMGIKYLYPRSDILFVTSEAMKIDYASLALITKNVQILNNGVNIKYLSNFKKKFYQNNDELNLIYVGRINKEKGLDFVIDKFTKIKNKIKLTIVGDGEYLKNLKFKVSKKNLSKRIIFSGFNPEPYNLISNADLLILPSEYEGFPNVILEALSLDIPVLASSNCIALRDFENVTLINFENQFVNFINKFKKYKIKTESLHNYDLENVISTFEEKLLQLTTK